MKKYLNIHEVSKLTGIKEHVIRYWDSIDPKTQEYRFEGISTKSKKGTRYFNKDNISKIQNIKNLLYENGNQNYTLRLVKKLLTKKNISKKNDYFDDIATKPNSLKNEVKLREILNKMRNLIK